MSPGARKIDAYKPCFTMDAEMFQDVLGSTNHVLEVRRTVIRTIRHAARRGRDTEKRREGEKLHFTTTCRSRGAGRRRERQVFTSEERG